MKTTEIKEKPPHRSSKNGGRVQGEVLGQVEDLEIHVPSDWWRWLFNPLYLKTDGDMIEDNRITSLEVDKLVGLLQPTPETRILDLCCGQGRHTLELHRRGYCQVEGFDRSHYLIQKARRRAKGEGLEVRFREGDARKILYDADSFDALLILGNSFGYFETVEDDLQVLQGALRVLKPGGTLVLDITDGEYMRSNYESRSWEWADKKLYVCRERALSSNGERLITREIISHTEKGVIADQFYAERLYNRESISRLLMRAGFSGIQFHDAAPVQSSRNQDLGMLTERLLVTAVAGKLALAPQLEQQPLLRSIVVVLGDPRKNDSVKPAAVFDEDDFHTIDEMKQALEGAGTRTYKYLDNHDTLLKDLDSVKGEADLILNLCDEGFDNNPRYELHVPAMLEVLGIPYTGAGPQCLAFCYDKSLVRGVAKEMGIPVPEAVLVKAEDVSFELPMPLPAIVKPNFGDSSFGIVHRSIASKPEELIEAVAHIRNRFGYEKPILVEELLTGQDLSVGILGNPPEDYVVLPIVEEDYSILPEGLPHICGYEAKWMPESPYWNLRSIPAELPEGTRSFITDSCLKLFHRLECRDYTRFDWRISGEGTPKLLEVNPNPGWCWDGHLARMAHLAGMSYADLLGAILSFAERRLARERHTLSPVIGVR